MRVCFVRPALLAMLNQQLILPIIMQAFWPFLVRRRNLSGGGDGDYEVFDVLLGLPVAQ